MTAMATATPCDERRALQGKLVELRHALCEAQWRRKSALLDARVKCRAERIAMQEKARTARMQTEAALREQARAERDAAHVACRQRLAEARDATGDLERARLALRAEEALQRDLRKSARADRLRRRQASKETGVGPKGETDDQVLAKLTSELVPLFDRVKKLVKPGARESRTEAFLRYAEQHPDEVLVAANDPADVRVRALEEERRRTAEGARARRGDRKGQGKTAKRIVLLDLKSRNFVRQGRTIEGERAKGQHAEIVVGAAIRLYGIYPNHVRGPKPYDRTFRIGDEAEYDSYNVSYTGKIVSIGAKSIGIRAPGEGIRRLHIADFSRRNWDFDADVTAARNTETMKGL